MGLANYILYMDTVLFHTSNSNPTSSELVVDNVALQTLFKAFLTSNSKLQRP